MFRNKYCCKTCGAESPAGIGYAVSPTAALPAPTPGCIGPHLSTESARHDGMADAYDQLRAIDEPHRDWTPEIRAHREAQEQDKAAGNLASWSYHQGIITVLSEHCTCRFHAALYQPAN